MTGDRNEREALPGPDPVIDPALHALWAQGRRSPDEASPDAAWDGLTASLDRERGWAARLRSLSTTRRWLVALGIGIAVPLLVAVGSPRSDFPVYPAGRMQLDVLLLTGAWLMMLALVLRPLFRPAWPRWLRIGLGSAAFAVGLALAGLPMAHVDHPASLAGAGDDLARRALACFVYGTVCAMPMWIGAVLVARSGYAFAIALAAAAVGQLSVYLHCPIVQPLHLALGHATIVVPFAVWSLLRWIRARA